MLDKLENNLYNEIKLEIILVRQDIECFHYCLDNNILEYILYSVNRKIEIILRKGGRH